MTSNGSAALGTCLKNGTDFTSICTYEQKTCISDISKDSLCGNFADMKSVELVSNVSCIADVYFNNFEYIMNSPSLIPGK